MQAMNEMPCMEEQRLLGLRLLPLLRDRLCFAGVNPGSLGSIPFPVFGMPQRANGCMQVRCNEATEG